VPAFIEQRAIPAAFALALAVASVLLANGAVPEALRIDERELAYFERHPFDLPRKPRLWAQGWLADDLDARAPGGAAR
jgi:hypothetical protein